MKFFDSVSKLGKKAAQGVGKLGKQVTNVSNLAQAGLSTVSNVQRQLSKIDKGSGGLLSSTLKKVPVVGDLAAKSFDPQTRERVDLLRDKLKKVSKAGQLVQDVSSGKKGVFQGVKEGIKQGQDWKKPPKRAGGAGGPVSAKPEAGGKRRPVPEPDEAEEGSSVPQAPPVSEGSSIPKAPPIPVPQLIESTATEKPKPQYVPKPAPKPAGGRPQPPDDLLAQLRAGVQLKKTSGPQKQSPGNSHEDALAKAIAARRMKMGEAKIVESVPKPEESPASVPLPEDDEEDWDE